MATDAVGLAVGLDDGRPHAGHGQRRAVEGVARPRCPARRRPVADVGPAGLVVAEPRHRRHLEPLVAAGRVDLDVERARDGSGRGRRCRCRRPGRPGRARRSVPSARPSSSSCSGLGLLGRGVGEDLDLVELVDPQQAAGVAAGRAGLPPEARACSAMRRIGSSASSRISSRAQRGERHLGGGDGPQVVALDVVGVVGELRQLAGGGQGVGAHERRRAGSPRRRRRCGRARAGTAPGPAWRPAPR